MLLGAAPLAGADDHDSRSRAFPSEREVATAKALTAQKARDVGAIKASLLLANQQLEQAAVVAEQASEAYNGVMWRLQLAKEAVSTAQAEAVAARATVRQQRRVIGALMAASYQQGSELTAVGAMMGADGPEGVLDQYAAFQGASESLQADYDRFAASDALAQVFEEKAQEAREKQQRLVAAASVAKDQATEAAASAQEAATQVAAEKDRLIGELARAQSISFEVAQQRQSALEEIARQRAEARARAEAEAAARRQAAAEAAAAEARERADAQDRAAAQAAEAAKTTPSTPGNVPAPPPPPSGSGGATRAIAFAKAQLGEPYVWGAAGPSSWDCSGLMMGAWGAAGVSLPHYSAAQYSAGTPISSSSLRPGDLVFWGGSASSIHHVAMYLGNGMIIHAPRTGRPVAIESMYYWIPPNFFARV